LIRHLRTEKVNFMILQRIKYFFTKNPLDKLDYEELLSDRIRYEDDIRTLQATIPAIDKEIDDYWNKAKETKSPTDERALAERINSLSLKRNSLLKKISGTESHLRIVEEFIDKIEEKNTKRSTDPLTKGSQMELEGMLNKISEYEEERQQLEKTLTGVADSRTDTIDDNVSEILQAIKATKASPTYNIKPESEQVPARHKDLESDN
jgi:chromosome segregation ATPase